MMRSIRGSSLASTLVFIALAILVGAALASSAITHLHFGSSQSHRQKAQLVAEATLALASERLLKEPQFGLGEGEEQSLTISFDQAEGRLTFDRDLASDWDMPHSTNNKGSEASTTGFQDFQVPPESIHLISQGKAGGITKTIEAVLEVPGFPYALVSSGRIESEGSLVIGGLENLEDAFPSVPIHDLEPADLAANAPGESIEIQGRAEITGDIQAVGSIVLGEQVDLAGELKPQSRSVALTELDLHSLRPDASLPQTEFSAATVTGSRHVTSSGGNVHFSKGLTLDDGVLYVDGDLVIQGGLRGHGALLVNGSLTILGGAALAAENQVALVSKGDVTLTGSGTDSYFQGLVYTEGDFIAKDCTLLGSFVANQESSPIDPGSRLHLEDVAVVQVPSLTRFESEGREIRFTLGQQVSEQRDNHRQIIDFTFSLSGDREKAEEFTTWLRNLRSSPTTVGDNPNLRMEFERLGIRMVDSVGTEITIPARRQDEEGVGPHGLDDFEREFLKAVRDESLQFESGDPFEFEQLEPAFVFDLNEFLNEVERTRVVLWREI